MAKGKSPGLDGVVVEFYTYFWDMNDWGGLLQDD
jgi:hypothetical protein